jgi:hypothetical protein
MGHVVEAKQFNRHLLCFNPASCILRFQILSCAEPGGVAFRLLPVELAPDSPARITDHLALELS